MFTTHEGDDGALTDLTEAEQVVVQMAVRGIATKVIAHELGIASSTVSSRLARAARRAGLSSRHELLRRASRALGCGCIAEVGLTDAERQVLVLLQAGLSNAAIASMRARSRRTIANQVASILRKTQSGSRRGLVCLRLERCSA